MNFEEAKNTLKAAYLKAGLELLEEHSDKLVLKNSKQIFGGIVIISFEEIQSFLDFEVLRNSFKRIEHKCSICSSNYREQAIVHSRREIFSGRGDRTYFFGDISDTEMYCEISKASDKFFNFFVTDEDYLAYATQRVQPKSTYYTSTTKEVELNRPYTIKIHNMQEASPEKAEIKSTSIIEACLFELSYLKNAPYVLQEAWSRMPLHGTAPRANRHRRGNNLPIPRINIDSTKFRLFQRGMSTNDPVLQFLSFYQVLEAFFDDVSNTELYEKLKRKISDPRFLPNPSNLAYIVKEVSEYKKNVADNETELLKLVLKTYVHEDELIEFIREVEEQIGKIYSSNEKVFGDDGKINLQSGHTISNTAKRVKLIRDALVHNSGRFRDKESYIPNNTAEEKLRKEIPLIKFLAERSIIASGDITQG